MQNWQEAVYLHLPVALQNLACSLWGYQQRKLRYGGKFREIFDWLEQSQWWSYDKIERYREEQLHRLLHHAYATVPYYRTLMERAGLKPESIGSRR